ncbi:hypothetical protein EVAR_98412_1 [Eumeta japonica]|uniref:Uncharacterized protein n=1 Tax=Eumeta variegata TaxID=151549 RepID=A0A4C2ABZ3_EUMVA|nr:hypothetical protein EVAR_98412_1 [Eumeta japonica]
MFVDPVRHVALSHISQYHIRRERASVFVRFDRELKNHDECCVIALMLAPHYGKAKSDEVVFRFGIGSDGSAQCSRRLRRFVPLSETKTGEMVVCRSLKCPKSPYPSYVKSIINSNPSQKRDPGVHRECLRALVDQLGDVVARKQARHAAQFACEHTHTLHVNGGLQRRNKYCVYKQNVR